MNLSKIMDKNISSGAENKWKIPLFKMQSEQDDIDAVTRVIRRATFWADGPEVKELESYLRAWSGKKYALTFNSGTSALHTLLLAAEVAGGEVIVPSFTFISTVNAVVLAGAKPIFAESEMETFGLDTKDVKSRISNNTKAVVALHYGGVVSKDIDILKELCREKGILLIEDTAEAMGALRNDQLAGTFGHAAMYSFCQNKIAASGEGGAIITDLRELYEKMKLLRSHGRLEQDGHDYFLSTKDNDYLEPGYNYRMPSMVAALALSQMKRMDSMIQQRQTLAKEFIQRLGTIRSIGLPVTPEDQNHVYQMFTILLESGEVRNQLQDHLEKKGIMTKVYFNPVHLKSYYLKNYPVARGDMIRTEQLSRHVLTLPFFIGMNKAEKELLLGEIEEFFRQIYKK